MRKKIVQFAAMLLAAVLCVPGFANGVGREAIRDNQLIRVGLYYGSTTLPTANLENSAGTGYRFGFFDESKQFVPLWNTDKTKISMLKTQNIYLTAEKTYTDSKPASPAGIVGCYHIQMPGEYSDYTTAKAAAGAISGGFAAWVNGTYYVRLGAYATQEEAASAITVLGVTDATVVGTSAYGVTVTETGTTSILFQFDGGAERALAVKPGLDDSVKTTTWFKNFKYYGSFRYERRSGGNLTVVNFVPLEDYVKGVIPYEMSASWPIEALKAQSVCARTYTICNLNKHKGDGFDMCNTTDCQVYYGTERSNSNSDKAVDETWGNYAWYNGQLATTFYHSSNGGATENSENVWVAAYPYLTGVTDTYEAPVTDQINKIYPYNWSYTFTKAQLRDKLIAKGYNKCGEIVDFYIAKKTPTGNVYSITFVDSLGETYTFYKESVRTFLGVRSMRYSVAKNGGAEGGGGGGSYSINGSAEVTSLDGLYAIGSGGTAPLDGQTYVATKDGTAALAPAGGTAAGPVAESYTVSGTGWGHHIGMSQWGAYSMANQGKTYQDILKFYFTGIEIGS